MTETNLESIQNKMDTNLQNIISILKKDPFQNATLHFQDPILYF